MRGRAGHSLAPRPPLLDALSSPATFRDWCISRQLWWGHRIPAYLVVEEHAKVSRREWKGGLGLARRASAQESEGFQRWSQLCF